MTLREEVVETEEQSYLVVKAKIVNKIYSGWQISLTDGFDIGGCRSVLH